VLWHLVIPALALFSIVAALAWRMPRLAAEAALAAGIVAIADAIVFYAAYAAAPRDRWNGCVRLDSSVERLAGVFFLIGAAAAIVSAAAGLAAALKGVRAARSLVVGAGSVVAAISCFWLVIVIVFCGD
jgi:hypothetical protein